MRWKRCSVACHLHQRPFMEETRRKIFLNVFDSMLTRVSLRHKTYAEIDATACLGDPYPKTPRRFRQPRSKSVTPPLFDLDAFDYYQYARPQAWTPLMQAQTPVRRPQTPVQDYQQCSRPQTPVRQQQTPVKQTPARATTPARTASPLLQQQTPIRAQSSPRLDYYESPSASACRPKSAPKSLLNLSPKTPVSYQSSTPYTPLR